MTFVVSFLLTASWAYSQTYNKVNLLLCAHFLVNTFGRRWNNVFEWKIHVKSQDEKKNMISNFRQYQLFVLCVLRNVTPKRFQLLTFWLNQTILFSFLSFHLSKFFFVLFNFLAETKTSFWAVYGFFV